MKLSKYLENKEKERIAKTIAERRDKIEQTQKYEWEEIERIRKYDQWKENMKKQQQKDMHNQVSWCLSDPVDPNTALYNAKRVFLDSNKGHSQLYKNMILNSRNGQELQHNIQICMDSDDHEYTDSCSPFSPITPR